MSYSPVEIRHVRFRRSLLGYRRASVDHALAEIASSYESVWQERMDLTDRVEELEREVARHRDVEELLRTTLMTAERASQGVPVIVNLQNADQELSKRLVDFASGLTYALSGSMQRVADRVFLLTPHNVEVSAEERARVLERGGFFNQA